MSCAKYASYLEYQRFLFGAPKRGYSTQFTGFGVLGWEGSKSGLLWWGLERVRRGHDLRGVFWGVGRALHLACFRFRCERGDRVS